jgi:hypothetical protein
LRASASRRAATLSSIRAEIILSIRKNDNVSISDRQSREKRSPMIPPAL